MQNRIIRRPRTKEEYEARLAKQTKWEIYFRDEHWGSVALADGRLQVEGSNSAAINRLLDSMRRHMDDADLFQSLPHRLKGHVHTAFPKGEGW
jgi:hypothetical protein